MDTKDCLNTLLNEDRESCNLRERATFDQLTAGTQGIVLFGAGGLGRRILRALRVDGVEPLGFIDNKLAGSIVDGLKVLSPEEGARKWGTTAAFVVAIWASWADTMRQQIQSLQLLGCRFVTTFIPLLWKYPHLLPHVQVDLPSKVLASRQDILKAFELWADEQSRREFLAQLRWRLFGEFDELGDPVPDQYWQRDLIRLPQDAVFADAGAFDGDTLVQFISFTSGKFGRVLLFEPDRLNIKAIQDRLNAMPEDLRGRVSLFDFAVADREYDVSFNGGAGASSALGSGSDMVHCVPLDSILSDTPHLIKYDIEGFELMGLSGSRRLIEDHNPRLIVCAYHTQGHLWEIPLLIHSMNSNYKFYLRPHGQIWETVCYAIPS